MGSIPVGGSEFFSEKILKFNYLFSLSNWLTSTAFLLHCGIKTCKILQ